MIDERTFEALLSRMEDETLDFKSTAPKITYEPDKARFIKDIICMANTPRNEPSYIIYGVKKLPDGSNLLLSLDKDTDEELLQSQFSEERVYPIPVFTYSTVLYQQKTFGIICIPPVRIGVCRPRKGFFDILQPSLVYFRRGSKNAVALPEDIARIVNWMKDGHVSSSESSPPTDEEWENFLFKVHHFESSRGYLLLAAPLAIEHVYDNISVLGNIPCSMVFDFDPNSESNGLLKYTRETLTKQRSLHLVVIRDRPTIHPDRSTYWFFARGLQGRQTTIKDGPYSEWRKVYGNELREQLKRLAEGISPIPITCIALWYNTNLDDHLRATLDDINTVLQDAVDSVIVTQNSGDMQSIQRATGAALVEIPFHQLCSGLQSYFSSRHSPKEELCELPSSSGAPIVLDHKTRQWLEEELELVHLAAGLTPPSSDYTRREFLRGAEAEISWYGLDKNYDVTRDRIHAIKHDLEEPLEKRRTVRVNLYHEAGAGGTTLARRALWDLHTTHPCAILLQCNPAETAERLYRIASFTGNSVLLLIDSARIVDRQVNELYNYLRYRQIPTVLFQILRRFKNKDKH